MDLNIKKYEKDIREANRKRGLPGRYHGFKCTAVRYDERDHEWLITLSTPFGEGGEPIGGKGIMEFIRQRFTTFMAAFWEVKLKYMTQYEDRQGCFWRVTMMVRISPEALQYGILMEDGDLYLDVKFVQKLLDWSCE